MRSAVVVLLALLLTPVTALWQGRSTESKTLRLARVLPLSADEGVFAYARISPNGRFLAYASERARTRTITVVDLRSQTRVFNEPGIDAYWSPDGRRMVYFSAEYGVSIRDHLTGAIVRDVAPRKLGDYYSWAVRDGRDLILTIDSNYYYLAGDKAVLPHSRVTTCPEIGVGDRPLISRDGRRITSFVRGTIVVRSLTECGEVTSTNMQGGKADFSADGHFIAFHSPKADDSGYQITIVDLLRRTRRTLVLPLGSTYFPSWTDDGQLSFRYDGRDYRGFMMASNVLSLPEQPLPPSPVDLPAHPRWEQLFSDGRPRERVNVVLIWSSWSAHSPDALIALKRMMRRLPMDPEGPVAVFTALDIGSYRPDVEALLRRHRIALPEIVLANVKFRLTEAVNQIPTTLLFRDGRQVDRRLGAQTEDQLVEWISAAR